MEVSVLIGLRLLIYPSFFTEFGALLQNSSLKEFQVGFLVITDLAASILSFLGSRWLRVVLDEKSSQEQPVLAGPILDLTLSYDVTSNIAIFANDTTLFSTFHRVSNLWEQQELVSELESVLRGTVRWDRN